MSRRGAVACKVEFVDAETRATQPSKTWAAALYALSNSNFCEYVVQSVDNNCCEYADMWLSVRNPTTITTMDGMMVLHMKG